MDNLRGINTDLSHKNQPPGTYRFALNAINNSKEGDMKSISNEQGNEFDVSFTTNFLPIGSCFINPDYTIVLSAGIEGLEDYVRIDKRVNGLLQNIMYIKDSGWTTSKQVKIKHKVLNGCDDIIIITDGQNPIRYINISQLQNYLLDGETTTSANLDGEGWDLGLMNISPDFQSPTLSSIDVSDSSGNLEIGSYIIVPQYLTSSLDPSSWLSHIGVIPIYDEPFYGEYTNIDGGTTTLVETTNKAIRLQFTNLDTSFSYLRLALISNIDGAISSNIIATIPITSTGVNYIITGNEVKTAIALEEIVIDNNIYDSAEDIELYDDRLWLLNVKERQIDHAILQQAAFNVKAHWFTTNINAEISGGLDTKSATYYLNYRSYMRDEAYAFGIQYRFKNGWLSRVYALASREKDTGFYTSLPTNTEPNPWHNRLAPTTGWDSTLYRVGVDIPLVDVEHLGFTTGSEDIGDGPGYVQRWKVFNTATVDSSVGSGLYFSSGEFAYTESTDRYPSNSVYGSNSGQPIRDFKFPDAILNQIGYGEAGTNAGASFETDYIAKNYRIFPIGIAFTDINIPAEYADEIVGYEIVRIERNEFNSTVLDKGILTKVVETQFSGTVDEDYIQQLFGTTFTNVVEPDYTKFINDKYQVLHNPLSKFTNSISGSYIKVEGEHHGRSELYPGTGNLGRVMIVPGDDLGGINTFSETLYNRKIVAKDFIASDSLSTSSLSINVDNTEQQEGLFIELNNTLPFNKLPIATDNFFLYAAIKQLISNQYGTVEGRVYIPTDSILHTETSCEIYGGDIFISPLTYRRCERMDRKYNPLNHEEEDSGGSAFTLHSRYLYKHYVESTINCNLRHEGTDDTEIYYPKSAYEDIQSFLNIEGDWSTDLIPNYYAYNSAFSQENNIKTYFGLPFNFDYDNNCIGEFNTRIACSQKDNIESSADSNKIFLPNNYRDLPKNKGVGLSLFTRADKLYAHFERTLYLIPVKDQAVKVGDINAYFGTGEVLSIPPNELITIEKGYAGLSSKSSFIDTPYGSLFVSHEDRKVFLLSDSLEPISNLGLATWSFDNMKFKFIDSFNDLMRQANLPIAFDRFRNNCSPYGIGFHSTYDPRYDRVIITKRDYKIKFGIGIGSGLFSGIYNSLIVYPEGSIVWNTTDQVFEVVTGVGLGNQIRTPINYYDTDYFENHSFTLSYSFLSKSWVSFHSYIPLFYMYDKEQFYSLNYTQSKVVNGSTINYTPSASSFDLYKHAATSSFQRYYGFRKNHIIDLVMTTNSPSNFSNIFLDTRASILDTTYNEWYDVEDITYSNFIAYNTRQCTGQHNIVILDDYNEATNWSSNISYARRLNTVWRINNLRDLVSSRTMSYFTSQYSDISSNYFIDKVLNENAINYDTSQYELKRMNDTWLGIRLTFNAIPQQLDSNKIKLTTNIIETLNYQSR